METTSTIIGKQIWVHQQNNIILRFVQNKIAFEQQYQRFRGELNYQEATLSISENKTQAKMKMPYWWIMGGKDNYETVYNY